MKNEKGVVNSINGKNNSGNNKDIERIRNKLKRLVNKDELFFTKRCNSAINLTMEFSKAKDAQELYIQDQGGWIHYEKLGKKYSLNEYRLKTKNGSIVKEDLQNLKPANNVHKIGVLLINSLPGYSFEEDMREISKEIQRKSNNLLLINDCCGTIGTGQAKYGVFAVCSFGKAKPLSIGCGGFISYNSSILKTLNVLQRKKFEEDLAQEELAALKIIDFVKLDQEINNLEKKLEFWKTLSNNLKIDLTKKGLSILNEGEQGINVIVSFENLSDKEKSSQKEKLIKYLEERRLEYTMCPRYIRSNIEGISVEVKRVPFIEKV